MPVGPWVQQGWRYVSCISVCTRPVTSRRIRYAATPLCCLHNASCLVQDAERNGYLLASYYHGYFVTSHRACLMSSTIQTAVCIGPGLAALHGRRIALFCMLLGRHFQLGKLSERVFKMFSQLLSKATEKYVCRDFLCISYTTVFG